MTEETRTSPGPWYKGRTGVTLLVLGGIVAIYALAEHWEHAWSYLPWLIILACPLMHVFMHRGHGGHGGNHGPAGRDDAGEPKQGD